MLRRLLFGKQRPRRRRAPRRRVPSFDLLEARAMLSGDPPPWIGPTDEGLPDATITPVEGPATELTQEEIDACSGNWQSLTIRVYVTDYFTGDVNGTLNDVAEFYQDYCILITWEIVHIHTPPIAVQESIPVGTGDTSIVQTDYETNPNQQYLGELDLNTSPGQPVDLANEPELDWFLDHFDNVPSIFLIDDIDLPGLSFGPDAAGLTYDDFIFVPDDALMDNAYDNTIAHEIGHLLGLPHADGSDPHDIMAPGGDVADLEDDYFTDDEVNQMNASDHLVPIPDPDPTP